MSHVGLQDINSVSGLRCYAPARPSAPFPMGQVPAAVFPGLR